MMVPVAVIAHPVVPFFFISSHAAPQSFCSTTSCRLAMHEPSFSATKHRSLCIRMVRAQPLTTTSLVPMADFPTASTLEMRTRLENESSDRLPADDASSAAPPPAAEAEPLMEMPAPHEKGVWPGGTPDMPAGVEMLPESAPPPASI